MVVGWWPSFSLELVKFKSLGGEEHDDGHGLAGFVAVWLENQLVAIYSDLVVICGSLWQFFGTNMLGFSQ